MSPKLKQDKSPAYQWYPKDILSSARVAELSLTEEGAYRRALDYCWLNGDLPASPPALAKIIGKGCTSKVAAKVAGMFVEMEGRLIHERLNEERSKQAENRERRSQNGKKGNEKRWQQGAGNQQQISQSDENEVANLSHRDDLETANTIANDRSSSSSSSSFISSSTTKQNSDTQDFENHETFSLYLQSMDSGAQMERESIAMQVQEAVTPPLLRQFNAHLFTEKKCHATQHEYTRHLRSWMLTRPKGNYTQSPKKDFKNGSHDTKIAGNGANTSGYGAISMEQSG